ncbi:fimbrial protein [Edaphovirga cremea]|uniref:fimbrial protein n=1 Tax=Edaphovirga cremea TaxID=2267246 RepID=UPI00398993A8
MKKLTQVLLAVLATGIGLYSGGAAAEVGANECARYVSSALFADVVDLGNQTITVGSDAGSMADVYYVTITLSNNVGASCRVETTTKVMTLTAYDSTPLPEIANASALLFETGVSGLSVEMRVNQGIPLNRSGVSTSVSLLGNQGKAVSMTVSLFFTKRGVITPGVIHGTDLPTIKITGSGSDNPLVTGFPFEIGTLRFTGQLNVVSGSCVTPDLAVDLGRHDIPETFTGIGTTSPWVDSSMMLTGCPAFKGFYNTGNGTLTMKASGTVPLGIPNSNIMRITVSPSGSGVYDAANGLFTIATGSGTAKGVGLQLARGDFNIPGSLSMIELNKSFSMNVSSDAPGTIKLPMAVRYYQTSSTVTPGKANGKVTVNILYY